jgi:cytochrome c
LKLFFKTLFFRETPTMKPSKLFAALGCALLVYAGAVHADQAVGDAAKALAVNAGCFTCHSIQHKDAPAGKLPIGPAWEDVALQYKDKPGAAEFLTRIVLEGSNPYASHWKNKAAGIAMPPNSVVITEAQARQLVYWVLSLK